MTGAQHALLSYHVEHARVIGHSAGICNSRFQSSCVLWQLGYGAHEVRAGRRHRVQRVLLRMIFVTLEDARGVSCGRALVHLNVCLQFSILLVGSIGLTRIHATIDEARGIIVRAAELLDLEKLFHRLHK